MFDFSGIKKTSEEIELEQESTIKLDMNLLLEKIDTADYNYYESLSEKEKKHFTPYTVLRWVSSLDDSTVVTYNAKKLEAIFGKWSAGGRETLNELRAELAQSGINCISVSKYEHAKFDWRIKFSVQSTSDAKALVKMMQDDFGVGGSETLSLIDTTTAKYQLIMLNDMVNDGFWDLKEHPELVYQLLCSVSEVIGAEKRNHTWLPFPKGLKNVDKTVLQIIKDSVSTLTANQMNEQEYKILLLQYSKDTFDKLLQDFGYPDSERKPIMKLFKAECEKYGKTI